MSQESFVRFSKETQYFGRNGSGRCKGLSVWDASNNPQPTDLIFIHPINSKGETSSSAEFQIPRQDLEKLCLALGLSLVERLLSSPAIKDRLPLLVGFDPAIDQILEMKLKEVQDA